MMAVNTAFFAATHRDNLDYDNLDDSPE